MPIQRKLIEGERLQVAKELLENKDFDRIQTPQVAEQTVNWMEAAMDRKQPFGTRLTNFIAGESHLGRGVGSVLDFATIFLPFGNKVDNARDAIRIITGRRQKQNNKTMAILNDKPWYQSKTIWSAILIVVAGLLQAFGVDIAGNPEVTQTVYQILYTLAGAFGLYGLRDAIGDKMDKK